MEFFFFLYVPPCLLYPVHENLTLNAILNRLIPRNANTRYSFEFHLNTIFQNLGVSIEKFSLSFHRYAVICALLIKWLTILLFRTQILEDWILSPSSGGNYSWTRRQRLAPSSHLSIYPSISSIYLPIYSYPSTYLSIYLPIYIYLSTELKWVGSIRRRRQDWVSETLRLK
jgi:hypothetical protein